MRGLVAVAVVVAQGSCVFDTAGLSAPSSDRPGGGEAVGHAEGTRDTPSPVDRHLLDRGDAPRTDAPPDQARSDLPGPDLPKLDQKQSDLPRLDLPKLDQKTPDLRAPDLRAPDLRKPDLRAPDLRAPDLRTPDLRKPDLRTPDLRKPDLAAPSCQSLFGSAPGYTECTASNTTSCRFYFSSSGSTCNQLCGTHACLKVEDNASGQKCVAEVPNACGGSPCTCSSSMQDAICTCSR